MFSHPCSSPHPSPPSPPHLFKNHPTILWSLCPRFSCHFSFPMLYCVCSFSHIPALFFAFLFNFLVPPLSYFCTALPPSCPAACLLCVCGAPPFLCLLPFHHFLFLPSFLFSFRCLFVRRWSQSLETPSPVRRAPVCAAVGPSAAQQPCGIPLVLLWGPLDLCAWSGRCALATASSTAAPARWQVELEEVEQGGRGFPN